MHGPQIGIDRPVHACKSIQQRDDCCCDRDGCDMPQVHGVHGVAVWCRTVLVREHYWCSSTPLLPCTQNNIHYNYPRCSVCRTTKAVDHYHADRYATSTKPRLCRAQGTVSVSEPRAYLALYQGDYQAVFAMLQQQRATVLQLLTANHPQGSEAAAPRNWWDWVHGWKPAPTVLTTIDGVAVDETSTHGAAVRAAVDELERWKEAAGHLRWALVHLHATAVTVPKAPRATLGDPTTKAGKQLGKEQAKLEAQRGKVLELLRQAGGAAEGGSDGAYEVDPASKQVGFGIRLCGHQVVVTNNKPLPKGKALIQEIHKYEKQKSKLVRMASKQGVEVNQDELDTFGVYTDSGVVLDPSNQGVKQLLKQASSAQRLGVAPKEAFVDAAPNMDSDSMDDYASAKEESLASSPGVSARPTPVPVVKSTMDEVPLPVGVAGRAVR